MKRKAFGCSLILFGVIAAVSAIFITSGARMVSRIEEATEDADVVILERYYVPEVVNRSTISPQDLQNWISSNLQTRPPLPFDARLCWVPHHRIILRGEGSDREIEICFECDMFKFESSQRTIPVSWRDELRSLFVAYGIPATTPDIEEFETARRKRAEQDESLKP